MLRKVLIVMLTIIGAFVIFVGCVFSCCGCQSAAVETGKYTGQALHTEYHRSPTPTIIVVNPRNDGGTATATVTKTADGQVDVQVIKGEPAVNSSYTIEPEVQDGDKYAGSRVMTWAGEAPSSAAEKIMTQRGKQQHNPLPSVRFDDKGAPIASSGGGSQEEDKGVGVLGSIGLWFHDLWTWITMNLFWGIILIIAVFVVLPLVFPFLAPIVGAVGGFIKRVVVAVWNWFIGRFKKTTPPVTTPPVTTPPVTTLPVTTPPVTTPSSTTTPTV
jgi:hypothetical protein